ncbi:unnamed protein product [Blepharisma stoltei]|uniref:Transmembrane protein n=1 Tax=Blepharisma stoltei TaxID=1481888 RepID=A0AAU9JEY3_9CILI|nr:unnamed protein product [Blepharisma stoltei]
MSMTINELSEIIPIQKDAEEAEEAESSLLFSKIVSQPKNEIQENVSIDSGGLLSENHEDDDDIFFRTKKEKIEKMHSPGAPPVKKYVLCRWLGEWGYTDFIMLFVFMGVGYSMGALMVLASHNSEVKVDAYKSFIVGVLIPTFFVYALAGFIIIKARITRKWLILIIISAIIPPICVPMIYYWGNLDFNTAFLLSVFSVALGFFLLLKWFRHAAARYSLSFANILVSLYCILIPLVCIGIPLYKFMLTGTINQSFIVSIFSYLLAPILLIIGLPWVFIHVKYFLIPKNETNFYIEILNKCCRSTVLVSKKRKMCFNIPSIVIFMTMMGCECYALSILFTGTKDSESNESYYLSGMIFILNPLFTLVGVPFSGSKIQKDDKFCFCAILSSFVPLLVSVPLYMYITYSKISIVLEWAVITPPISALYWVIMSLIKLQNSTVYQMIIAFGCVFLVFPIGFILPYMMTGDISNTYGLPIVFLLLGIALISTILYLGLGLVKFCRLAPAQRKALIMKLSMYNFALLIEFVSFSLCVAGLVYVFCNGSSLDWTLGVILGIIILLPFTYLATSISLRTTLHEKSLDSLTELISGISEESSLNAFYIKKKRKYQIINHFICLFILPLMIVGMVLSSNKVQKNIFSTLCVGISVLSIMFTAFIQIKKVLNSYGRIGISILTSLCWLFVIIPLACILPCALALYTSDSGLSTTINTALAITGFICIIGVSAASVIFNMVLKRMEEEKRAKYCVEKLRIGLRKIAVRGNENILRLIYERCKSTGLGELLKDLVDGAIFFWLSVREDDPDLRVDKFIVKSEMMGKLKEMEDAELLEKMKKKEKISCWKMLGCFSNFEEENEILKEAAAKKKDDSLVAFDLENLDEVPIDTVKEQADESEKGLLELNERYFKAIKIIKENYPRLEFIKKKNLSRRRYDQLANSRECFAIQSDKELRDYWLSLVFNVFAAVDYPNEAPWINHKSFKIFTELGGLSSSEYFPDSLLDLTFLKISYKIENGKKVLKKMTETVFNEELLLDLAKIRYERFEPNEGIIKLITEYLYPNLMNNIPKVLRNPEIWEGLKKSGDVLHEVNKKDLTDIGEELTAHREAFTVSTAKASIDPPPTTSNENQKIFMQSELNELYLQEQKKRKKYKIEKCCDGCAYVIVVIIEFFSKLFVKLFIKIDRYLSGREEIRPMVQDITDDEIIKERRKSPDWPEISKEIVRLLDEGIKEADEKLRSKVDNFTVRKNATNIIFLINKVVEFYTLSAIAFREEVQWEIINKEGNTASETGYAESPYFREIFWVCFGLTFAYLFLAKKAMKYAKQGRLGKMSNGDPAKLFTWQFWLSKSVQILGGSCYIMIVKNFLNTFACNMTQNPWKVYGVDMQCFSPEHWWYIFFAILGVSVYYPIATFLFPLLQFQDYGLDFKMDATFLVVLSQCKLLIAATATFVPYGTFISYQLWASFTFISIILIFSLYMNPCIIRKLNMWNSTGYLMCVFTVGMALFNVCTDQHLLAFVFLCAGNVVIFAAALVIWIIRRKRSRNKIVVLNNEDKEM